VKNKVWSIVVVILMLLSMSGFSACSRTIDKELIIEAVVEFWEAYEKKEYTVCLTHLSDRLRDEKGDDNLLASLAAARESDGGVKIKDIGHPVMIGPKATIQVETVFDKTGPKPTEHRLIKKGQDWKIDEY